MPLDYSKYMNRMPDPYLRIGEGTSPEERARLTEEYNNETKKKLEQFRVDLFKAYKVNPKHPKAKLLWDTVQRLADNRGWSTTEKLFAVISPLLVTKEKKKKVMAEEVKPNLMGA